MHSRLCWLAEPVKGHAGSCRAKNELTVPLQSKLRKPSFFNYKVPLPTSRQGPTGRAAMLHFPEISQKHLVCKGYGCGADRRYVQRRVGAPSRVYSRQRGLWIELALQDAKERRRLALQDVAGKAQKEVIKVENVLCNHGSAVRAGPEDGDEVADGSDNSAMCDTPGAVALRLRPGDPVGVTSGQILAASSRLPSIISAGCSVTSSKHEGMADSPGLLKKPHFNSDGLAAAGPRTSARLSHLTRSGRGLEGGKETGLLPSASKKLAKLNLNPQTIIPERQAAQLHGARASEADGGGEKPTANSVVLPLVASALTETGLLPVSGRVAGWQNPRESQTAGASKQDFLAVLTPKLSILTMKAINMIPCGHTATVAKTFHGSVDIST